MAGFVDGFRKRFSIRWRRPGGQGAWLLLVVGAIALVGAGAASSAPKPPPPKQLCVGKGPGPKCFPTLAAALAAAHDGDTIQIHPGTYAGGVTIDPSVDIVGAGADKTTIKGGGPVVTVGEPFSTSEPTVVITGVTITGGNNGSTPDPSFARGGGILVPPGQDPTTGDLGPGATVTLRDSVVSGNTAAPTDSFFPDGGPDQNPGWPVCPGNNLCPFAGGFGGGIDTWGALTVDGSTVSGNTAGGPVASDADGGGIHVGPVGSLTLTNSSITGNSAVAVPPNGRFAEGGGIFTDDGPTLVVDNSTIAGNTSSLTSQIPDPYPFQDGPDNMNANSGGIHVGDGASVTIENSHIDGNAVSVSDPNGQPAAFDGGMCVCGNSPLDLTGGSVSNNEVTASVVDTTVSGPDGSALEFDGDATVSGTQVTNNTSTVSSPNGAAALGAISAFDQNGLALLSGVQISGNTMSATGKKGPASVQGGGVSNNGFLDLQNVDISGNDGTAHGHGPDGFAQGGGIWNGALFGSSPQQLTLENSTVDHNTLEAGHGTRAQGGGIYSCGFSFTLDHSQVRDNRPDQIFHCPPSPPAGVAPALRAGAGRSSGDALGWRSTG